MSIRSHDAQMQPCGSTAQVPWRMQVFSLYNHLYIICCVRRQADLGAGVIISSKTYQKSTANYIQKVGTFLQHLRLNLTQCSCGQNSWDSDTGPLILYLELRVHPRACRVCPCWPCDHCDCCHCWFDLRVRLQQISCWTPSNPNEGIIPGP